MKNIIISAIFLFCLSTNSFAGIDFESKAQQIISEIIANPSAFFYDFQQDLEGTLPLTPGKSLGFQTGLFPTVIPLGYLNLSGKYRAHPEGRFMPGIPQFDLIAGYWNMIWAKLVSNQSADVNKAVFNGYYYGFIMSSSVSPRIRTFWGYKHSQLKAELGLKPDDKGKYPELMGVEIKNFDTGFKDDFIIAGLEHPKGINKFWSIQLNYGIKEKVIATKVSWYGKWFELGLNIYPEGVLVIHPVWNFHLNF